MLTAMAAGAQNNWHFQDNKDGTCKVIPIGHNHQHFWYWDGDTPRYTSVYGTCHSYIGNADIPATDGNGNIVTGIGEGCFEKCVIQSVTIPSTVKDIEARAFTECRLTTVTIPEGVETIGNDAFFSCDTLNTVSLPGTLLKIGANAFRNMKALKTLTIPASVDSIGEGAFMGLDSLQSLTIANGSKPLIIAVGRGYGGEGMFAYSHQPMLTDAYVGRQWSAEGALFSNNPTLKRVTFGLEVTDIPQASFAECSALENVAFANGLKHIGPWAFHNCKQLKEVILPEGLEHIDVGAFLYCQAATTLTLPKTLRLIDQEAFLGMEAIDRITIPASVDSVGRGAFNEMNALKTLVIEDSENTIHFANSKDYGGEGMFGYNHHPALEEAYIGRNWTVPSHGLFEGQDGYKVSTLKRLTIGNLVTAIPSASFLYCPDLEQVTIGNGVKTIGDFAFCGDKALGVISVAAIVPPTCDNYTFANVNKQTCSLYVPKGSLQAYKEAPIWKDFFNIEEMEETKCYTPTATLADGRLHFECETKGVTFHYKYTYPEDREGIGNDINVVRTIHLTLYASKAGLEDSDVAEYDLLIAGGGSNARKGDVNEDGKVDVADIATVLTIMASE